MRKVKRRCRPAHAVKPASLHLSCEIEDTEGLHSVRRYGILVVNDSDVAKPQSLNQSLNDLVVRDGAVCFRCHWCWHQC